METKKKKKKTRIWILIALVIIIAIVVLILPRGNVNAISQIKYSNYTVTKGSVESTVTGSGKLESADTEDIYVPDKVTISDVLVDSGDSVKSGQTLATLDTDSLKDRAASLSDDISSLDSKLAQMNSSKTVKYVYATEKGRIKYIPVSKGDDAVQSVSDYGALAIISTDGLMQVEIKTDSELSLHSKVTVKWDGVSVTGQIRNKTIGGYLITLSDYSAPYNKTAQIYSGETLLGEGVLGVHAPVAVYANGGTISKIYYNVNDKVSVNAKLFMLSYKPFTNSYQQKYLERTDKAQQLQVILNLLNNPVITSHSDGVISQVKFSDGDTTETTSDGKSIAFVVNTGGAVKMVVDVNELDIQSVKLDQKATVTLDSFPSEKLTGTVTRISSIGNTDKSITTFPVELTLSYDARFNTGMNGTATIMVNQSEGVLIVPIEAINEDPSGAFVYRGKEREKVYIETGISDGEYAEITKGLSEGDVLSYVKSDSSDSSSSSASGMKSPFGGSMPGNGGEVSK